ncbi:MAG TPA: hypothetical protein VEC36_13185 [Patescibacteria group bacterium]|nr:hypothetical protein [Patescibacteria group bacterium]
MKKYFAITALAASLSLGACSESTTDVNSSQPQLRLTSEMSTAHVSGTTLKSGGDIGFSEGATVDSLRITAVRTLISRIKLHRDKEDSTGDRDFKSQPVILTARADTSYVVTTQAIPAGTYDKVKFEFHKLSSSEANNVANDTNFRYFTQPDRATFVIEGILYKNGTPENFTYRSDATANLNLNIQPALTISEGTTATVALRYDPLMIFKTGQQILDPRDSKNESHIDNMIKNAIKALKK